jgi:uncharacterized membrane protein YfcA
MGGAGAGIAMIPILNMLGFDLNIAKMTGLFIGFTTTFTSTVMNLKRKVLDIKFALPLALTLLVFAPVGAQLSKFVDKGVVKILFAIFLIISATMMIFFKKRAKTNLQTPVILALTGAIIGLLSGLLGVGGGNMLLPILVLFGYEPKKVAITVSFVVPFSAFTSFLSYATFVHIDWLLLISTTVGAITGGYIGNYMMHFKLTQTQIRKIIAIILYILAIKMIW